MTYVAISRSDGALTVMQVLQGTVQDAVQKWAESWALAGVQIVSTREVLEQDVPRRRDFRDAWVDTGAAIDHDIAKAREIQRNRIRSERTPRLEALDVDSLQALEEGLPVDDVKAAKQALRDAPADPRIDAASTLDELSALTLDTILSSQTRKRRK